MNGTKLKNATSDGKNPVSVTLIGLIIKGGVSNAGKVHFSNMPYYVLIVAL